MPTTTISTRLWGQDLDLHVEFTYYRGRPATWHDPTEEAEIDLLTVIDTESGVDLTEYLHRPQEERIYEEIWERIRV